MRNLVNRFRQNPQKLLLIDFIGAVISTISLGFVLVYLEAYFGIPRQALFILALLACLLVFFDLYSYVWVDSMRLGRQLKLLGVLNITYVLFSIIYLVTMHYSSVLILGWIYLILEVVIVLFLAALEIQVAAALKKER